MDISAQVGQVTVEEVIAALRELGGRAEWKDIYNTLLSNRTGDYSYYKNERSFKKTANQCIQQHCRGYGKYLGGQEKFIRDGIFFNLSESDISTPSESENKTQITQQNPPIASKVELPTLPERVKQETNRILRDPLLARNVKEENGYECEICHNSIDLKDGRLYAEVHHLMPLGKPHDGPDVRENIICVCPNDHVRLDYGAIALDFRELSGVGKVYVDYHNKKIYKKE